MIKDSVTVTDDLGRVNECHVVFPHDPNWIKLAARFKVSRGPIYLPLTTRDGKKIQSVIERHVEYSGRKLELAVLRAKRFIRSNKRAGEKLPRPPYHIAMALAAFLASDPDGFREAMS